MFACVNGEVNEDDDNDDVNVDEVDVKEMKKLTTKSWERESFLFSCFAGRFKRDWSEWMGNKKRAGFNLRTNKLWVLFFHMTSCCWKGVQHVSKDSRWKALGCIYLASWWLHAWSKRVCWVEKNKPTLSDLSVKGCGNCEFLVIIAPERVSYYYLALHLRECDVWLKGKSKEETKPDVNFMTRYC